MSVKTMTTMRLSELTRQRLADIAEAWGTSQAGVVEHAISVLADNRIGILGRSMGALSQALMAYAAMIADASKVNAETFSRAEWNLMADANNGCSPMISEVMGDGRLSWLSEDGAISGPVAMIAANVADAAELGEKWGLKPREVRRLIQKLRDLDSVRAMAVVIALQRFWESNTDHKTDEWWLI